MKNVCVARVGDFSDPKFQCAFKELETFSNRFVQTALKLGLFPKNYPWPIDPLHNWSRMWEYPYVWMKLIRQMDTSSRFIIADYGSGLTFFPWFLASKGFTVIACDLSSSILRKHKLLTQLANSLGIKGHVQYLKMDVTKNAIASSSVDIITNISIIEHLHDNKNLILESARILRHNGLFISTLDVTLDGLPFGDGNPLSLPKVYQFIRTTSRYFNISGNLSRNIPPDALRFSSHSQEFMSHHNDIQYPSLELWLQWGVYGRFVRPLIKVMKNRVLSGSAGQFLHRFYAFLFNPYRLDMWTVMGIVAKKSKNS